MNSAGLVVAVLYVLLGLLAGRFPRLLVFVVVPVIVAFVWYDRHYGGPYDRITGVAAIIGALLGMFLFLAAAALSWQARRAWKRTHSKDREETLPRDRRNEPDR